MPKPEPPITALRARQRNKQSVEGTCFLYITSACQEGEFVTVWESINKWFDHRLCIWVDTNSSTLIWKSLPKYLATLIIHCPRQDWTTTNHSSDPGVLKNEPVNLYPAEHHSERNKSFWQVHHTVGITANDCSESKQSSVTVWAQQLCQVHCRAHSTSVSSFPQT